MKSLPSQDAMMKAFMAGDPGAEGIFFVAVKTTGIFCRPTCSARKPLPKNVVFFATSDEALHEGYRPCKRCQPMSDLKALPEFVQLLRNRLEADPASRITDKDLAGLGIDPSTARRQFQRYFGMSFHAYQRKTRLGQALAGIRQGRDVLSAGLDTGYESASAFRDAFSKLFGQPPGASCEADCLKARWIETPLGTMLALADDQGLHLLDFLDRKGVERKISDLRTQLKRAIIPGTHPVLDATAASIAAYFDGSNFQFNLPLAPSGSAWQLAVWNHLLTIAPGQTKSYVQMAQELGRPTASRAIGNANGLNYLAIVIPCHRVIRADGSLCGYGGGLWRKQWLLDHEREHHKTAGLLF